MSGPRVDIFVGPQRKQYKLPKLLLCHYSKFFDRCFNGNFLEGATQTLELPEDKVEYFDVLVDFMLHGRVSPEAVAAATSSWEHGCDVDRPPPYEYFKIIEYADKYKLAEATTSLVEPYLETHFITCEPVEQQIELIYRAFPAGNIIRSTVAQGYLSSEMPFRDSGFEEQEQNVVGFAAEVLAELRKCLTRVEWLDPITGMARIFNPNPETIDPADEEDIQNESLLT